MNIQYISWKNQPYEGMECTTIDNPMAFDSFDINIIDLSYHYLWRCNEPQLSIPTLKSDFNNLRSIIDHSNCENIIFLLPQNIELQYHKALNNRTGRYEYSKSEQLKNNLNYYLRPVLKEIGPGIDSFIRFENNRYIINGETYNSSFYFDIAGKSDDILPLQKAVNSHKIVTIKTKRIIYTFLELKSEDNIVSFLSDLGLFSQNVIPDWLNDLNFFNDDELKNIISEKKAVIVTEENNIKLLNNQLLKNKDYEKILIFNDKELVDRVLDILDQMLKTNLKDFHDVHDEDFLFKANNTTFIGEIKGVNSNVKSEHISQVDEHLSKYEDKLQDEGKTENLKALLIINHQRSLPVSQRKPVDQKQIDKAIRDNVLIIETTTLLTLFDCFLENKFTSDNIIQLFKISKGLLKLE